MKLAAITTALCTVAFCGTATAGPAKGNVECEGAKHAIKSAVALWVPEKKQFQVMFFGDGMSDADLALAARIEGESILGKVPKGMQPQTTEDMKKRREFSQKRAILMRGYVKEVAAKVEDANLQGAVLVSVNCGPNKSFNQSMRVGDKDATADLKKQFPGFTIPLKADAVVKINSGKYSHKPDPANKHGNKMTATWQFQGESKLAVFE